MKNARASLVLALGLVAFAGCRGAPPRDDLPLTIAADEALIPFPAPVRPEDTVARIEHTVLYVEVPPRGVKAFPDYARGVGLAFLHALANPFRLPLAVLELLLGWLDLETTYGTAFIVTSRGHAITNAHVVGDAEWVRVARADGAYGRGKVVARDDERDLAVIRLKLPDGTRLAPEEVAPIGSSAEVKLGQRVVLYGYPTRPFRQSDPKPTVTHGIVSSLGLDVGEAASRMQLDAPANAGNSGGPVFDERGRVIGVVTEAADPGTFEGQSFAIPIEDVEKAFLRPDQ